MNPEIRSAAVVMMTAFGTPEVMAGALELGAARAADRVGRERLPDDRLADVGRDEERDAAAEAVALLQQLVEADDDDAGEEELRDDEVCTCVNLFFQVPNVILS